jgi:peptide deformylase
MAVLEITQLPASILRRKAHKVDAVTKELQTLIDNMIDTMREAPGVGLAAPQVDVPLRVIVVEYGDDEDESKPKKLYVLMNPEILRTSEEVIEGIEACLSVPDLAGVVDRFEEVTVKGINRQGKSVKIKASGWLARIFQHEIDHVDGIVFTDRAKRVWQPKPDEEETKDV